jgi:membrane-associated phospholipid phosphatase
MLDTWFNLIRALPMYIFLFTLLESLIFYDIRGLLLFFGGILCEVINMLLKIICKSIFYKYGYLYNKGYYLPLLGRGDRPLNAKNCSFFSTCDNKNETSFGFPSGHSQFIMFFTFFIISYLYFNNNNRNNKLIGMILIFIIALFAVYTRVQINCHTIQQVIYGSLIGSVLGIIYFLFTKKYFNFY